jgi:hypothetical protein
MLLAPSYHEVDLPVYEADSPLTDPARLEGAETLTSTTFLRAVHADFYTADNSETGIGLKDFLDEADAELERAAGLCRASVAGHRWGLMQQPSDQRPYTHNLAIPEGHILVAEVDIIRDAVQLDLLQLPKALSTSVTGTIAVGIGMARYNHGLRRGHRLIDMMPSQFVLGTCPKVDDVSRAWLVDIEPRIKYS